MSDSSTDGRTAPNRIVLGDNLDVLRTVEDGAASLVYIDPPFNTGRTQRRERLSTQRDEESGDRTGFQGRRYRTTRLGVRSFPDAFDDYFDFMEPRLEEARRILSPTGSLFLHLDYREVHYCKVLLDGIFGVDCFMNEIIWAYDYGGRPKGPVAGQARLAAVVREGPGPLHLQLRRDRPHPVHGARSRGRGKGGAGQDAN